MTVQRRFLAAAAVVCASLLAGGPFAASEELAGTSPITWDEDDLSTRMMDGAHRFVERKIAEAPAKRSKFWAKDFSSRDAYVRSIEPNRERFQTILGVVDRRLPTEMERYATDENPSLIAETAKYRVYQVRWPVLEGVWGSGLLIQPIGLTRAHLVVIPDADETPEQLLGLAPGIPQDAQGIRRLAENGFEIVIVQTISRTMLTTNDIPLQRSLQTHREWIYRQAFHMGRHVIGFEIQLALSAVDWFRNRNEADSKIGICGYAEGGLVAFYAAAIDPRISAALVSGYFDSRQEVWKEPIYRNVWGLLREFGDAEIAGMILPRHLTIEHSRVPEIIAHKGDWKTPDEQNVQLELQRIDLGSLLNRPEFIRSSSGPYSDAALNSLATQLAVGELAPISGDLPTDNRQKPSAASRHARLFHEMEDYVQRMIPKADHIREKTFPMAALPELTESRIVTDPEQQAARTSRFIENSKAVRERFHEEGMGRFDEPLLPFNARSRLIKETNAWKAYDVILDVYPELFAWGILVIPKDLTPGEKRPVVVCQHGRHGLPREMLDTNSPYYNNIAARLAERGFITFAPHNLYRGEDRYRWLARKANNVKATLFSFIIPSHDQILRWLNTQPFVDGNRIAFYGLSYGGETAVRVPTILEKYSLSICSGDFNQWTRKIAATDQPFSFMRTIEWEMPYWNLGNTFDYAEMAVLMFPRPFMVERGHLDGVGKDHWVAHEFAKVRWLYAQHGRADRTEIEFFQGGHTINGVGTVEFLHRHLNWPKPVDHASQSN